jgi:hypothetical protein
VRWEHVGWRIAASQMLNVTSDFFDINAKQNHYVFGRTRNAA